MFGHIKIDRKILKWEWYQDSNMVHLFIHLLLTANHADGSWQGKQVARGQLITSRGKLSITSGLSEMQVRVCLSKLKMTGEITIKVTNKYSLITICKYDTYQSSKSESNQQNIQQSNNEITGKITNKQPADNQQDNHKQEDKNDKNDKKIRKESAPENLKNSNLFRQPQIPALEDVQRVFLQRGGSLEMAEKFFEKNSGTGWYKNNSPITDFTYLVPSFMSSWAEINKNKNGASRTSEVGKTLHRDKA